MTTIQKGNKVYYQGTDLKTLDGKITNFGNTILERVRLEMTIDNLQRDLENCTNIYNKGGLGDATFANLRDSYLEKIAEAKRTLWDYLTKKLEARSTQNV